MKKQLVQANNVSDFICRADARIYVDTSALILTPGAKDELAKRKITIFYASCPDAADCTLHTRFVAGGSCGHAEEECEKKGVDKGFEKLLLGVAALLKKDYGISDPERLQALARQAVLTVRDNL